MNVFRINITKRTQDLPLSKTYIICNPFQIPIYCFGLFEVLELPSCTAEQLRYWESFQEL